MSFIILTDGWCPFTGAAGAVSQGQLVTGGWCLDTGEAEALSQGQLVTGGWCLVTGTGGARYVLRYNWLVYAYAK